MKQARTDAIVCFLTAFLGGTAASFIYYCESLQFLPLLSKGVLGRLMIAFAAGWLFFVALFFLIRKGIRNTAPREWLPIILISLTASVCAMVWFEVPHTGLLAEHTLEIRALPDENGEMRPVTLTWLHRKDDNKDIPLSAVLCEGNCAPGPDGQTIFDETGRLFWKGKTGNVITIEFVSGDGEGVAEYSWNGIPHIVPLNNKDLTRLSYDCALPVSSGLPEFAAVWILCLMLCLAAVTAAVKLLPGWDLRKFGACAFAVFVIFRILQFHTAESPLFFVDSQSYLGLSRLSLPDILGGTKFCHIEGWHCLSRPPLVPLVYKLCRQDPAAICLVQLAVSLLCWGFFAGKAAGLCTTDAGKKAALILSLGLGCVPNVTRWDQMIMSESLSISAGVLMMGCLFWLTKPDREKRWLPLPAVFSALCGTIFALSRDSAVWAAILVVILLLCIARLRRNKKVIYSLCAVLAAVCGLIMGGTGDRWEYSFENVLFNRIMRDPQGESFFIESGMPLPKHIEDLYGTEHVMTTELFNSDEFKPLREWILSDGLKTYFRYILRTPVKALRMTWYDGFEAGAFEEISYRYSPHGFSPLLPDPVFKLFSCSLPGILVIGLALSAVFMAFRCSGGEKFAFPILFVLSAYILSTAANLADEYELDRHIMAIILMMKAALWPLIIMLGEEFLMKNHKNRR